MASVKKESKKPIYSISQFATNLVEEFDQVINRHAYKNNGQHYSGILLYSSNNLEFSEVLKDLTFNELKIKGLEESVSFTNSLEKYHFSSNGLNYYVIDVDWFVNSGWIASPNFSLVGNPY